jgi:hypothetical protein
VAPEIEWPARSGIYQEDTTIANEQSIEVRLWPELYSQVIHFGYSLRTYLLALILTIGI